MSIKLHVKIEVAGEAPKDFDLQFDKDQISIGRQKGCDVLIPLPAISRKHAIIFHADGKYFLKDLNATHGTYANGVALGSGGERELKNGDVIGLVHTRISVEFEAQEDVSQRHESTAVVAREAMGRALNADNSQNPYLRIDSGPGAGQIFAIDEFFSEITIGRGDTCEFQIKDPNVSRKHVRVTREWDHFILEDLGSKNAVLINGKKLSGNHQLLDGDKIQLGHVVLSFVDPHERVYGALDAPKPQKKELPKGSEAIPEQKAASSLPPVPAVSVAAVGENSGKMGGVEYALLGLGVVVFVGLLAGLGVLLGA